MAFLLCMAAPGSVSKQQRNILSSSWLSLSHLVLSRHTESLVIFPTGVFFEFEVCKWWVCKKEQKLIYKNSKLLVAILTSYVSNGCIDWGRSSQRLCWERIWGPSRTSGDSPGATQPCLLRVCRGQVFSTSGPCSSLHLQSLLLKLWHVLSCCSSSPWKVILWCSQCIISGSFRSSCTSLGH